MFLDLKEGAMVVSLKPFAPTKCQRLNECNKDDISPIFDVSEHTYGSGTVSWSNGWGKYISIPWIAQAIAQVTKDTRK